MALKILIIEASGWGGVAHYTYNLARSLSAIPGLEVTLLTDENYELGGLPQGFTLIREPLRQAPYLSAVRRIIRTISSVRPDVVHIQTLVTARRDWVLFLAGRLLGMKIIFTAHNVLPHDEPEKRAFFMKDAFRIIYACSRKVIVHSAYSREKLINLFNVPSSKICVIPHGNYLFMRTRELSQSEAKKCLGIPQDKKVVLHFGAIRHYKGIDTLLSAFKELRKVHEEAVLLIAGKPINIAAGHYRKMADALGLGGSVLFKEEYIRFEDIACYFGASDIAVFPYKEIDTSGSLQAAYAFARPVVVTRSGGAAEAVVDGVNGILVAPEDPHSLNAAMKKILSDDGLRRRMGEASFKLAQERFSWDKIARSTSGLYLEACS